MWHIRSREWCTVSTYFLFSLSYFIHLFITFIYLLTYLSVIASFNELPILSPQYVRVVCRVKVKIENWENNNMLGYARQPLCFLQSVLAVSGSTSYCRSLGLRGQVLLRSASTGKASSNKASAWKKYGKLVGAGFGVGACVGGFYMYERYKIINTPLASPSEGGEYALQQPPPYFKPARSVSSIEAP